LPPTHFQLIAPLQLEELYSQSNPFVAFTKIPATDDIVFLIFGHYGFSPEASSHVFAMGNQLLLS